MLGTHRQVRGDFCHSECPNPRVPKTPRFHGHQHEDNGARSFVEVRVVPWVTLVPSICSGEGCPAGMELVSCADRCPRRCSDLQEETACQDGPACQPGCRCSEGVWGPQPSQPCLRAAQWGAGGARVGPWGPAPRWRAASPQAHWSRTAAACHGGTVSAQTSRAAAGPRAASTRRPAATARAERGSSPARLRPARPLPTVPGAAGQPGVHAADRVGPGGGRAGSGTGLGWAGVPAPCPSSPASWDAGPL